MSIKMVFTTVILFLVSLTAVADQTNQVSRYHNQRGSVLELQWHQTGNNSGTITGTFTTKVAAKDCQQAVGKSVPVTGFFSGDAISINTSYPECGSVISFVGNKDEKNQLHTIWLVAHKGEHADKENWNTRFVGHDEFSPAG